MTTGKKNANQIKVMSYNLHYHRAFNEVHQILRDQKPDVVCLQECKTDQLPDTIDDIYELADKTSSGRLDVALYYRADRFTLTFSKIEGLDDSMIERVLHYTQDRLVLAKLIDDQNQAEYIIASLHASPLNATNQLRRLQITETCHLITDLANQGESCVIIGDFNYPLFRRGLAKLVSGLGFEMWRTDENTFQMGILADKFDLLLTKDATMHSFHAIKSSDSDHNPVNAIISSK